ncbi:hypothetical protein Afil01_28730 [Actinorhabdospora filicis]|uniref:Uncharacterized protein n=1 Tax=Actinorhabdospora filicis TaxID=1785913 RepID=A0A9W6W9Z5_9ACTN|nr:hypothetical protein [Actinorhabdospora filicis]GLZ78066.1 hypothetical protein Afil01_28730 [Actinorhabdospora filicis]
MGNKKWKITRGVEAERVYRKLPGGTRNLVDAIANGIAADPKSGTQVGEQWTITANLITVSYVLITKDTTANIIAIRF